MPSNHALSWIATRRSRTSDRPEAWFYVARAVSRAGQCHCLPALLRFPGRIGNHRASQVRLRTCRMSCFMEGVETGYARGLEVLQVPRKISAESWAVTPALENTPTPGVH